MSWLAGIVSARGAGRRRSVRGGREAMLAMAAGRGMAGWPGGGMMRSCGSCGPR